MSGRRGCGKAVQQTMAAAAVVVAAFVCINSAGSVSAAERINTKESIAATTVAQVKGSRLKNLTEEYLGNRWCDLKQILVAQAGLGSISLLEVIFHEGLVEDELFFFFLPALVPEAEIESPCVFRLAVHAGIRDMWGIANGRLKRTRELVVGFPWTQLDSGRGNWESRKAFCWHYDLEAEEGHAYEIIPLLRTLDEEKGGFGPPVRWADVRIGVTTLPVAGSVGVSPGEIVDFFAGWLGIDIARDDKK